MGPIFDEQVCYTLYSTSSMVTKAYKPLLQNVNLTYPQFVVMMSLWQKDGVSVTELALGVGLAKATMTPLLKRLELLGYVARNFESDNERQKCITLTAIGKSIVVEGDRIATQAFCATGLTSIEAKQLINICRKIKINLQGS